MPILMASMTKKNFCCLNVRNTMVPFMMPLALDDTDTSANGISLLKKSCYTSFWLSWPMKCNGAIDNTISITLCQGWYQCGHMTKMSLHLILSILISGMHWCYWWCCAHYMMLTPMQWHHMTPTSMPVVSSDANVNVHDITWQKEVIL